VLRHAEKTKDPKEPGLSKAGQERAQRLPQFITDKFGKPDHIFAAAISRNSARPYDTVLPLSQLTGVPIDATVADNDYGVLAQELLENKQYSGSLCLVCWHHGQIPPLLHALNAPAGTYTNPWNRDVFNLIIRLQYGEGTVPKVKQISQDE